MMLKRQRHDSLLVLVLVLDNDNDDGSNSQCFPSLMIDIDELGNNTICVLVDWLMMLILVEEKKTAIQIIYRQQTSSIRHCILHFTLL